MNKDVKRGLISLAIIIACVCCGVFLFLKYFQGMCPPYKDDTHLGYYRGKDGWQIADSNVSAQYVTVKNPSSPYAIPSYIASVNAPVNVYICGLDKDLNLSAPKGLWASYQYGVVFLSNAGTKRKITWDKSWIVMNGVTLPGNIGACEVLEVDFMWVSPSRIIVTGFSHIGHWALL